MKRGRLEIPLVVQVVMSVVLGTALGMSFGDRPYLFGHGNADLGELGLAVIRLLKALAVPLVFLAILDAFLRTRVTGRDALKLLGVCAINVSVALTIGLLLMNGLKPGERAGMSFGNPPEAASTARGTLDPLKNLTAHIPDSLVEPFARGGIITVVLLAVLAGAAIRRVREIQRRTGERSHEALEQLVEAAYLTLMQMVGWVVRAVPFAVFACLAQIVGRSGLSVFRPLWIFAGVILLGMALHALAYYPLVAWLLGRRSPRQFLGGGLDAILTGFSTNSSLATMPVTLRCLTDKLRVSSGSARLSACVGTNLNNDGITLYEAMATLFVAQAAGLHLGLGQQIAVVLAALMAGIGVAGVPEVGLVVLPLVLSAAGLPDATIAAALPLIIPVDWLLARCRSVVNVMGDMTVAVLLDGAAGGRSGERPR